MKEVDSLLAELKKNIFTISDASKLGLTRYYLNKLVEKNLILEVQKGIYQKSECKDFEDVEVLSFITTTIKLRERSAICLWSALSFYNLTDEVPREVWCILPYPYGVPSVKSIRLKNPKWEIGIDEYEKFAITSIERTIVDCFLSPNYVPVSESFSALKIAIKDKKTSVKKLIDMATKLNAKDKILPFIEIAI